MTRYEQGFMNKCAEYGLDAGTSMRLMKEAGLLDLFSRAVTKTKGAWNPLLRNSRKSLGKASARLVNAGRSGAGTLADRMRIAAGEGITRVNRGLGHVQDFLGSWAR